jgi:hypothetical protein
MHEFYSVFEEVLLENNLSEEISSLKKHIHKKRKPVEEFLQLLTENNFAVKEVSCNEFSYKFVCGTVMFRHFLINFAFVESWKELIDKKDHARIFNKIEQRLNFLASKNGIIQLTIPFVLIDSERI